MPEAESVNTTEPYRLRIGSYGVVHPLGTGGMSSVYLAVHLESGHEVALKVLPPYLARNPTVLKRFMGEAKSAEALEHPNIVSIYDRGSDQGRHYLVLEYVTGGDFHEYVQRNGPMAPAEAIEVIRQVVDGLEYALSRGLIHRDVKPSNLLRTPKGDVKITDLGLALRSEAEDERVTREGTTVGTVDYMAPEQARDSRATSFQSDIYSLGCTFHYLLTALPPYPGGDIADRLTRHVRNPPPDVRDLRPDLPYALAAVIKKMMAKHPEDRYESYADLRAALGEAARVVSGDESSIALVPLEDEVREPARPTRPPSVAGFNGPRPVESGVDEISLAELAPVELGSASLNGLDAEARSEDEPSPLDSVLQRFGSDGVRTRAEPLHDGDPFGARVSSISATEWVLRCVIVGLLAIVGIIGLDLVLRGPISVPPPPRRAVGPAAAPPIDRAPPAEVQTSPSPVAVPIDRRPTAIAKESPAAPAVASWVEPVDEAPLQPASTRYTPDVRMKYLPAWGRAPIVVATDGPTTLVRRAPETRDAGTVSSLRLGLDVPKGTIEIGDVGPFQIDDFRVPGDNRVIRARAGYRPVVQINGPLLDVVRALPAVVTLNDRGLTLDSLDLVVNVHDLALNQRTLFHLGGARLTLRDCTVTIVNPYKEPFTFLRADDPAGRPSRVRIEKCLIRGGVETMFDLRRGPVELMIERSILAGEGPIFQASGGPAPAEHRVHLLGGVLACRGPCFDLGGEDRSDPPPKRLVVRAFNTAFGRFQGPGTASLAASADPAARLAGRVDWLGDNNLFSGWRGYFAAGPEHTIRIRNLAGFRSTWSAVEQYGQENFIEWPRPEAIADLTTADLTPLLLGREVWLEEIARPRPYLLAKTLMEFPAPPMPVSRPASPSPPVRAAAGVPESQRVRVDPGLRLAPTLKPEPSAPGDESDVLIFNAESAEWNGDLGAFLRAKAVASASRLHIKAIGSGPKQCSPVRLPDGMRLELEVEPPTAAEAPWLSLVPQPDATGRALIELHGGALRLSRLRIQAEDESQLESLIHVDDGFLVLERCELTGPQGTKVPTTRLITYRAATTRPRPMESELFTIPWDRPACVLSDCIAITGGVGIEAEIGLGFVGLSRCIVAARGDAVRLSPAKVARDRFVADLRIERCTIASGASVVLMDAWPGTAPGPDRPWLISSSDTAYLDLHTRESVLLRGDAEAFAQGQVFCQQVNDAVEVFAFAEAGEGPPPNRIRDIVTQWINFWGNNHMRGVTGPRPGSSSATVRFVERPGAGRIEPDDLMLDLNHSPGRSSLNVGAPAELLNARRRLPPGRGG